MANTWIISDTHFGHQNICKFVNEDGSPLRPWDNADEMDEVLVNNWNSVVKPADTVYHLGDVVMNRKALPIMTRLNGKKKLVLGNHDIFDVYDDYAKYFYRVHGSVKLDNLLLTHIPVHIDSVPHWALANVHGHIHSRVIDHPLYYNVSVENIDYIPISIEDLKLRIATRQANYISDIKKNDVIVNNNVTQETTV